MSMPEEGNGRASIREVIDRIQELDDKWDKRFDDLSRRYVTQAVCHERHEHIDVEAIIRTTASSATTKAVTAAVVASVAAAILANVITG